MRYKEVSIAVELSAREDIVGILLMYNFESFSEDDEALHAYIPDNRWNEKLLTEIVKAIDKYKRNGKIERYDVTVRDIYPQNWQEQWEKSVTPLEIGKTVCIRPSWIPPVAGKSVDIVIDPGMAFGTGHHETTAMMIEHLEEYASNGMSVLDAGTGSGILAITSARLGAVHVSAFDNDPDACENARENIDCNDVAGIVSVYCGTLGELSATLNREFDLVLANIERNTIIELFPDLAARVRRNGFLILSGLLKNDRETIEAVSALNGFTLVKILERASSAGDVWIAMVAAR
jgi:ribosomal protein L11 methyltransferase